MNKALFQDLTTDCCSHAVPSVPGRTPRRDRNMPNCFVSTVQCPTMDDIDSDTMMIAAGIVISLIAVLEFYPSLRNTQEK